MNKNISQSYQALRKKSTIQTQDIQKNTYHSIVPKTRAKSITSTSIKKPLTIIKPPKIDLKKIEVNPFAFANRNSHNSSTDQTNSRSNNSDLEQQGTINQKLNNQDQLQTLQRQKQILEYRLRQETESCQQYQQNYQYLQERLEKLVIAKTNYITQINQFTQCLRQILQTND